MTLITTQFDYAALDKTDRAVVEQKTGEIRDRMGRAAQSIVEIGERLLVVKEKLGHGNFGEWLRVEFDWSEPTALRMMHVASRFKSVNLKDLKIGPSALYLLSSPSTPDEVREQFIEAAKSGVKVTHSDVRRAITTEEALAEAAELDAIDPLLIKYEDAKTKREAGKRESTAGADDGETIGNDFPTGKCEPKKWGDRVIPDDAPPLDLDVKNVPLMRWSNLVRDIQGCISRIPDKETLADLPAEKRRYFAERFRNFAEQMKEAVL